MPAICSSQASPLIDKHAQPPPVGLLALQIRKAKIRSPLMGVHLQGKESKFLKGIFLPDTTSYTVPQVLMH